MHSLAFQGIEQIGPAAGSYRDLALARNNDGYEMFLLDANGNVTEWSYETSVICSSLDGCKEPFSSGSWTDTTGKNGIPAMTGVSSISAKGNYRTRGGEYFAASFKNGGMAIYVNPSASTSGWKSRRTISGDWAAVAVAAGYPTTTGGMTMGMTSLAALDTKGMLHVWRGVDGPEITLKNAYGPYVAIDVGSYNGWLGDSGHDSGYGTVAAVSAQGKLSILGIPKSPGDNWQEGDSAIALNDFSDGISSTTTVSMVSYMSTYTSNQSGASFYYDDGPDMFWAPAGMPEPSSHKLIFETNGGTMTDPASQEVAEGDVPSKPADPTKPGFVFDGWYTDDGTFKNSFDFSRPLSADTTVYAKWVVAKMPTTGAPVGLSTTGVMAVGIGLVGVATALIRRRRI